MKKLLATFAILALCSVNAMATHVTDTPTQKTVDVTVTCHTYRAVAMNDISFPLDTFVAATETAPAAMKGSATFPVTYWTNADSTIKFSEPALSDAGNHMTLTAPDITISSTVNGFGQKTITNAGSVTVSVPLSEGTTAPTDLEILVTIGE